MARAEGAIAVEMEAAALFAVGDFRNVLVAELLYAGDNVGGESWDHREWKRAEIDPEVALLSRLRGLLRRAERRDRGKALVPARRAAISGSRMAPWRPRDLELQFRDDGMEKGAVSHGIRIAGTTIPAAGVEIHAASSAIPAAAFASRALCFGFPAATC